MFVKSCCIDDLYQQVQCTVNNAPASDKSLHDHLDWVWLWTRIQNHHWPRTKRIPTIHTDSVIFRVEGAAWILVLALE